MKVKMCLVKDTKNYSVYEASQDDVAKIAGKIYVSKRHDITQGTLNIAVEILPCAK